MALVDRAQKITLSPASEWPVIAPEPATVASLFTGYVIPLALIGPVCALLANAIFLHHLVIGVVAAVMGLVFELIGVFVVALIADALAPSFNGVKDGTQSLKWVAYANTPRWIAGVAQIIPLIGSFIVLIASLYGLYVLYLGAQPMMRVPQEKAIGYVVVVIVCYIVLFAILGAIVGATLAALAIGAAATAGAMR